jgi:hypothetical protein
MKREIGHRICEKPRALRLGATRDGAGGGVNTWDPSSGGEDDCITSDQARWDCGSNGNVADACLGDGNAVRPD